MFFNGKLFDGKSVQKTDSNKYAGFESWLKPVMVEDIDILISNKDIQILNNQSQNNFKA